MSSKKNTTPIPLQPLDELFGTAGDSANGICEVSVSSLHSFPNHPFKVNNDKKMEELVKSVTEYGVLVPGIVRMRSAGGYELVAGHRRRRACEIAGIQKMPVAMESGVVFHMGNRYISFSKRKEKGMPDDTPCDVKRILVGNQIILNLLMSNTQMQRFGIMETMRASHLELAGESCMIRTAANVRIDEESVLAYEVVRDTPDSYEKLMSKVERYYDLVNNEEYLASNYHGDAAYPQMIICGESLEHNIKIAEYLRENNMWREEDPVLFTEDLLNMKRSLVSIYALAEDNTQNWYALPESRNFFREAV